MSTTTDGVLDGIKRAIDSDDSQQLEALLRALAKWPDRIYLVVDKLFPELRGRSFLHRQDLNMFAYECGMGRVCAFGKLKCCQKLLELEASPNTMAEQTGQTEEVLMGPLHLAIAHEHHSCVLALLKDKRVKVDLQDSQGKTPLHIAVGAGYLEGVKALLSAGANPGAEDSLGRSVIEYAKQKKQMQCVHAIQEYIQAREQERMEVANAVTHANTSPFGPFLPEGGNETAPHSKGLSLPVYHQIKWLMHHRILDPRDMTDRVMTLLRSTDTFVVLSTLKEYEDRCRRGESFRTLEQELREEIPRLGSLQGIWKGLVPNKPFGFIETDDGRRVWCHERQAREVSVGMKVCFQLQERNGKEEASMMQALASTSHVRKTRMALYSTRGADGQQQAYETGCGAIPPQFLMMSYEEAKVILDMGCTTQHSTDLVRSDVPHLDKVYELPKCDFGLPATHNLFSGPKFQIARAQKSADFLNDIKSKLDEKDMEAWKPHTKKTLLNKDVTFTVRERIDVEMCTIAFLKMYEMLSAYDLVATANVAVTAFNTLHLCEAPGAFICATNHYIKSRFPQLSWNWVACTLNPYFEGNNTDAIVEDDAFINETRKHWFFGEDDSGDMRLPHNISATWERARQMGPVMLVTADGSVDCSFDPNRQEEITAQLHYCESVAAVGALEVGGSFVLKMFTLFESCSIGLIHLLSGLFDHTSICKPTMSTPGNSETYIVCKGFRGITEEYKNALLSFTGEVWPTSKDGLPLALVPEECISTRFMRSMMRAAEYFARLQGAVIERNLRLFEHFPQQEAANILLARKVIVREWMRRFGIRRIDRNCRISSRKLTGAAAGNRIGGQRSSGKGKDSGNLLERQQKRFERDEIRSGLIGKRGRNDEESGSELERPLAKRMKLDENCIEDSRMDDHADHEYVMHEVDPNEIIWLRRDDPDEMCQRQWFDFTSDYNWLIKGRHLKDFTMSKFCNTATFLSLMKERSKALIDAQVHRFGCYKVGRLGFVSRSALKLADIHCIISYALRERMPNLDGLFNGNHQDLSFLDLYGGRGGFSDFMLFRHGASINRWWLMNRKDKSPPNPAHFHSRCASKVVLGACDTVPIDSSDLDQMSMFLQTTGATMEPVGVVFGDGTVKKAHNFENVTGRSMEPLSMPTLWCQAWCALSVLRIGGTFICKVTDSFGRCAVGTYFLMCHCFRHVTIIKPSMSSPCKSERFLVALDFLGHTHNTVKQVRDHLFHAIRSMGPSSCENQDIREIVPTQMLLQQPFLDGIIKLNERHARLEIATREEMQQQPTEDVKLAESMEVSDFARKQMQKMGYKNGQGLGKNNDGRVAPVDPIKGSQTTRDGLITKSSVLVKSRRDDLKLILRQMGLIDSMGIATKLEESKGNSPPGNAVLGPSKTDASVEEVVGQ